MFFVHIRTSESFKHFSVEQRNDLAVLYLLHLTDESQPVLVKIPFLVIAQIHLSSSFQRQRVLLSQLLQ